MNAKVTNILSIFSDSCYEFKMDVIYNLLSSEDYATQIHLKYILFSK